MNEIEKRARELLACEYEKHDMGHIAEQIRDSSWTHNADRIPLAAIVAALSDVQEDAERYRWLCDGNGYFMEEEGLCHRTNEKHVADRKIDAARGATLSPDPQL